MIENSQCALFHKNSQFLLLYQCNRLVQHSVGGTLTPSPSLQAMLEIIIIMIVHYELGKVYRYSTQLHALWS